MSNSISITITDDSVIDLTSSFTLADHRSLTEVVISLDSDDSFLSTPNKRDVKKSDSKKRKIEIVKEKVSKKKKSPEALNTSSKFGDCVICYEELGSNPLASTKCGHVYCMKCLEASLKIEKRCPTCRTALKGKNSYHPLYLSK